MTRQYFPIMMLFARERIKKAHNGRETRGVLAESTSLTVGTKWSTICLFLNCSLLVFSPVFGGLLAFIAASYWSPLAVILTLARQAIFANPTLAGSLYVYWLGFCTYILYLGRPHSMNVIKYQTFSTPWRYRRDHVSHMRLDRLRRVWRPKLVPGSKPKRKSPPKSFPIFIVVDGGTVALAVTPTTTVQDIRDAVCERRSPSHGEGPIYLMGMWRPLFASETMASLGICGLHHFLIPPRLRGGAPGSMSVREDGAVVNEHGWVQGALNPDGTRKAAEDIDFGPDPGTPASQPSDTRRPQRDEKTRSRMQDALAIEAEPSDDDGRPKKRRARPKGRKSVKGKERASLSDAEDPIYLRTASETESDSDPEAAITHEELAAGLPTKTVPEGSRRRPKESEAKRARKKRKTKHASDEPLDTANTASAPAVAPSNTTEAGKRKKDSPMWLFWEDVTPRGDDGKKVGEDSFYRCRQGQSKKELKITKAMRGSLTGLIGHLKTHAPDMLRFYEILNGKYKTAGLTEEEIEIAEGRRVFQDRKDLMQFLSCYTGDHRQQTLRESLERVAEKNVGPWDQGKFERLLVECLSKRSNVPNYAVYLNVSIIALQN
ncbi:hypothetical protein C8R47DRAFT_1196660 [Mycena vitilis]|nr:hypothetical protein C8R47DRAFT_1196660 [Mycena vitilis]